VRMLNKERLVIVNPFDKEQVAMIEEFEQENEINTKTSEFLTRIQKSTTNKEYELLKKKSNEVEESIILECEGKVKDCCHIQGEKDRKSCNIFFSPIKTKLRNRHLLTFATDYALEDLGMEEVFVSVTPGDRNMIENLEARNFENLGEVEGKIVYLKERVDYLPPTRIVQCSY